MISTSQYLHSHVHFSHFLFRTSILPYFFHPAFFHPFPFFSPRFLTPTSFLLPFPHQLFPATFSSASAISLSHTSIPFPCLNFFHILPHFPHPDVFPFPPYLRPLMPAVFFTLQGQVKKSKNTIFYCTIKTFSLDYFAVHGIFSLPVSIWVIPGLQQLVSNRCKI